MVIRVRPTPTRVTTTVLYTPVDSPPLHVLLMGYPSAVRRQNFQSKRLDK